jgi:hypothetical protein
MKSNLDKDKWFLNKIKNKEISVKKNGEVFNNSTGRKIGSSQGDYIRIGVKDHEKNKIMIILAHRLVWIAFNGLIKDRSLQINHKDGVKTNNSLSNLELVFNKENVKHGYSIGLSSTSEKCKRKSSERMSGENNPLSKLSNDTVLKERIRFKNGKTSVKDLQKKYNLTLRTVKNFLMGITYKDIPEKCEQNLFSKVPGRKSKFSEKDVLRMVAMRKRGEAIKKIAEEFKTCRETVSKKTSHLM